MKWSRRVLRLFAAGLLSFSLLFPYFVGLVGPIRLMAVVVGLLVLMLELVLGPMSVRKTLLWVGAALLWCVGGIGVIELVARRLDDRLFAVNAEHLFVLLPLFGILGILLYKSDGARIYLITFLTFASIVAAVAIGEALLDRSLLGRDLNFLTSQREGLTRALVGSEHVLTLGASLAAAVPLTLKLRPLPLRLFAAALLVAGTWASGSRAPAILCTAVAVVQFFPFFQRFLQRHIWILFVVAAAVLVAVGYMAVYVWTPWIAGATGLDYSTNYRGAMYSLLPRILAGHPLGYLLGGPPPGVFVVGSQLRGPVDIAISADSEIVFAAFGLGWIGIVLYLGALSSAIGAIKSDFAVGFSALSMATLGLILALHSWDGMSPLWYVLVGITTYLVFTQIRAKKRQRAAISARHGRRRRSGQRMPSHSPFRQEIRS